MVIIKWGNNSTEKMQEAIESLAYEVAIAQSTSTVYGIADKVIVDILKCEGLKVEEVK